jgi:phage terminase large subunit
LSAPVKYQFAEKVGGLFGTSRYWIGHGGRGGLKSWSCARASALQGAERPLRFLCAREVQKSIKDSVHQLLCDQIKLLGLDGFYRITRDEITAANGTKFIFSGLSDQTAASIKSFEGIDICWVEEAHNVTRKSWDILIPTIRKPGSRIWVTFNPELDTDETWTRFVESPPENAEVVQLTYEDNPWFPEVLDSERKEFLRQVELGKRSLDDYNNIWRGQTRPAVAGAIYAQEVAQLQQGKRFCPVPYDPTLPVHRVWDLGWNDAMVVGMWQKSPMGLMLIDSLITSHTTYSDVVASLNQRKYRWGYDFLPHDGKHKNPQTGESAEILLKKLGCDPRDVPDVGIEGGIKAVRQAFGRLWIDAGAGDNRLVLNGLKRYRRSINATTNEPGPPLHDENSHPADMVRYAVVSADAMVATPVIADPYAGFARRHG